jgi:uncharacterized membrane protein YccF (DUF307 family)
MRTLLNVIWLLLSGIWMALGYALVGLILCVTIIGIPFGVQLFKIAGYTLWPFGRSVVKSAGHNAGSTVGNVLWLIPGLFLAFGHIVSAFFLAITIIGLPLAYANVKLIPISLSPFGREIVRDTDVRAALASHRMP